MAERVLKLIQEVTMRKDLEEAVGVVLRSYLEQKIAECKAEIRKYERRYGMSFEEFEKRIHDKEFSTEQERKHGIIQFENDYFEWSGAVDSLNYLREKLRLL